MINFIARNQATRFSRKTTGDEFAAWRFWPWNVCVWVCFYQDADGKQRPLLLLPSKSVEVYRVPLEPADRPSERCDQMTIEMGSVGQKTNQNYLGEAMPEARDDLGFSFIHLHMASITVIHISMREIFIHFFFIGRNGQ